MTDEVKCYVCGSDDIYIQDNDGFKYCYECGGKHNQLLEAIGR